MFPLIPLPNKEATSVGLCYARVLVLMEFPLIPLPNKEATEEIEEIYKEEEAVSINSTS